MQIDLYHLEFKHFKIFTLSGFELSPSCGAVSKQVTEQQSGTFARGVSE
jgi:hypothetical protein